MKSILLEMLIGFLVLITLIRSNDDINQEVISTRQQIVHHVFLFRVLTHFYLLMTSFQIHLCYFVNTVCNISGILKRLTACIFFSQ